MGSSRGSPDDAPGAQTVTPREGSPNTAYIVQIVYEGSPQHLLTTVRDLLALRAPLMEEIRALEANLSALPPAPEDPDDAKDTQEEFFPDNGEEALAAQASTAEAPKAPPAGKCASSDANIGWCVGGAGHVGAHVYGKDSPVGRPPKEEAPVLNPPPAGVSPSPSATPADASVSGAADREGAARTLQAKVDDFSAQASQDVPDMLEQSKAEPPKATKPPTAEELPKSRGTLEAAATSLLRLMAPGDGAEARGKRVELMQRCWQKKGWLEMTALPLSKFKAGLVALQTLSLETPAAPSVEDDVPDFDAPKGSVESTDPSEHESGGGEMPPETPQLVDGYVAPGDAETLRLWCEMEGQAEVWEDISKGVAMSEAGHRLLTPSQYRRIRSAVSWLVEKAAKDAVAQGTLV